MVVGEHEKFASAIISPNFKHFAETKSGSLPVPVVTGELIESPQILAAFNAEVEKYNRQVSPHERILRFRLVPDEWSPATGELSPTLKLKRQVISGKYKELLAEVYRK
jgi:long-chain acyl-CoA synthetase